MQKKDNKVKVFLGQISTKDKFTRLNHEGSDIKYKISSFTRLEHVYKFYEN